MPISRRQGLLAAVLLPALAPVAMPRSAMAQAADPAAAQIERLHATLLDVMKRAQALGIQGRYQQLAPVVQAVFDIPAMSRFAVGSRWTSFTPQEQQAVIQAFTRMTVASYASNFDGYSGQGFETQRVEDRGDEKIVVSRLLNPSGKPVDLTYRMHQADGAWRITDVLHDSISELSIRRSEFAAPVRQGAATLVQRLNELSDRLMKPA